MVKYAIRLLLFLLLCGGNYGLVYWLEVAFLDWFSGLSVLPQIFVGFIAGTTAWLCGILISNSLMRLGHWLIVREIGIFSCVFLGIFLTGCFIAAHICMTTFWLPGTSTLANLVTGLIAVQFTIYPLWQLTDLTKVQKP